MSQASLELLSEGSFNVKDAAAFSGIGRTELFRLMGQGAIAYFKQGNKRLIPRKALVSYLAGRFEEQKATT